MDLPLHRRQFIISRREYLIDGAWLSRRLPDGFTLSHHSDLNVSAVDNRTFVLGHAIGEAGRFVRIDWPYISGDASMLLGVFYGQIDGAPFVTSSPALACQIGKISPSQRELKWLVGSINWIPLPRSRVPELRRLFADQRLNMPLLQVSKREWMLCTHPSFAAARDSLAETLVDFCSQLGRTRHKIYLSLTAGRDSRTLAAALVAAGVRFEGLTQAMNHWPDIKIARDICKRLDVPHQVIYGQWVSDTRLPIWQEHTLRSYADADDAFLFSDNQYRFLEEGDVLLRGGAFEIGRQSYLERLQGLDMNNATGQLILDRFPRTSDPDGDVATALDEWLGWRRTNPTGLDLIDNFYLDQQLAGRVSSLIQALDLLPGDTLHPANSMPSFSALLSPGPVDRKKGLLQDAVIEKLCPALLLFPINPAPDRFDRAVQFTLQLERRSRQLFRKLLN